MRKPVTACTLRVTDGMVVRTDTETVKTLHKGVLEFLLLNHPLDCPVCDKGGECPLQDQTYTYGPTVSRSLDPKQRKAKAVDLGNFIVLDQERCILCRRCTRFDNEISQENNLIVGERAHDAVITTAERRAVRLLLLGQHHRTVPGWSPDERLVPLQGTSLGPGQGAFGLQRLLRRLQHPFGLSLRRIGARHVA